MKLLSVASIPKEFSYFYTVEPSNFASLPVPKQQEKIGAFFDLLRSLEREIKITFLRKNLPVLVDGNTTLKLVLQILVASHEQLDGLFDSLHYEYTIDAQKHKRMKITKEAVSDFSVNYQGVNAYAKCFSLYRIPKTLPWGWVTRYFLHAMRLM